MHLLTLNATGKQLAPPVEIAKKRRRLSQVIGRHVDRTRPHMIAVQNARNPLQPIDEAWVVRGWKVPPVKDASGNTITPGVVKPWPRRYLASDDIVVVVYLPRGGGSGGSAGRKSPLKIALSIAAIALVAFSGPIGGAIAGALGVTSAFGVAAITAGVVVAGSALMGLASKSKANKTPTDETKVYGINGGGNLPRPGGRIPRGYGRHWMKPDLSQPDFNQYDGDDLILTKRHTLGCGRYRVYALRAGKQTFWTEADGFLAPFNDPRNRIEIIKGQPSELAPSNVVAASGVGGELPRLEDIPQYAGPFLINQRGALVTRLQVDFQFPSGISRTDFYKSGSSKAGLPGEWGVQFEYASIDEGGNIVSGWQVLYSGNSGNEGTRFATHPLRYTKFKDVPAGRYAVRGVNVARDTSNQTSGNAHQNAATWDAASGWVGDTVVRPLVTEIVARLYATKATGNAAFGELEADASAIIPVWTGTEWVEQETSKAVWAYCDIMREQTYGGALPDNQVDRQMPAFYANALTKFDTFDGTIRGPVSVFDAASTVLLPMRAEPVHMGRFWSLVRDDTKSIRRHSITRRQMVKGSTRITFDLDVQSGAAHVIGEYDQNGDYRNPGQTTCVIGEASITPLRTNWQGVKSFEHAMHLTRWRAGIGAYRRQTIPFAVTLESRLYKRGDAISIDPWFIDGHATAGVLDLDGNVILTDWPVPLKGDDWAAFRDRKGREWGPIRIVGTAGSPDLLRLNADDVAQAATDTGLPLASIMDNGRGEMTTVRVGSLTVLKENYLIQTLQPTGPRKANVTAVIDDPRVWELIGQEIVTPPPGEGGLMPVEVPRILALSANAVQMAAGLRCDYTIVPGRGAERFEFGISYDGVRFETVQDAQITGSVSLNPVDPTTVIVRARAFGYSGLAGPYFSRPLSLGRSTVLGALLDDQSVEIEALSAEVAGEVRAISDLGRGLLTLDQATGDVGIDLAHDTIRGGMRQLSEAIQRLAEAQATETTNAYLARELIKVGTDRNFAAIERVDEARVSDNEAFAKVQTALAARLELAEGDIVGNATIVQGLSTFVNQIDGRVTSQAQDITSLRAEIDSTTANLSGVGTAVSGLTTRVTATEGQISVVSQDLVSLQSQVRDHNDYLIADAQAISTLTATTQEIDGRVTATAQRIEALGTTVNGQSAILTTFAQSIDGVKVQYGVTGDIDGQTGGFTFTGVRRLDGGASFTFKIRGDAFVDGTLTARALAAENIIVRSAQIGDLVVATRSIGYRQVTNLIPAISSNMRCEVTITPREGSYIVILAQAINGPNTELPDGTVPGTLYILRNNDLDQQINAIPNNTTYTGSGSSRRVRIFSQIIQGFDMSPTPGVPITYTVVNSAGADLPGIIMTVQEFAR